MLWNEGSLLEQMVIEKYVQIHIKSIVWNHRDWQRKFVNFLYNFKSYFCLFYTVGIVNEVRKYWVV